MPLPVDPRGRPPSRFLFRQFFFRAMLGLPRNSSDEAYAALAQDATIRFDAEGKYTNMGWWADGASDITAACEALLDRCASWAHIDEAEDVLDVGFGTGGPLVYWSGLTGARVSGVNRSKEQTAVAVKRVRASAEAERIQISRGDATHLGFRDRSFDAVLSVEAGFHFDRREDFFREAWRVLRPGGCLVMTDIVPSRERPWFAALAWWAFDRFMFAPRANRIPAHELRAQLEDVGFKVELDVCTRETIASFFASGSRSFGDPLARGASAVLSRIFLRWPPVECVFLRATKPETLDG